MTEQNSITIFTIPKPFEGHIGTIQYNAVKSWTLLQPRPQVLLFGDEAGIQEACLDLQVTQMPELDVNEFGTPLLDSVFRKAQEYAKHEVLMYVNADIILFEDIFKSLEKLKASSFNEYLVIGRRIDVDIIDRLDYGSSSWAGELKNVAAMKGELASVVCRDYFIFPKGLYSDVPPFAVGRGHWDSWMVYQAHKLHLPVVDATGAITAIHQNHDYRHLSGTRGKAYVKGEEPKRNAQLAGGMHVVTGAKTNWKITSSGIKRKPLSSLSIFFDLPRYLKLLKSIFWE